MESHHRKLNIPKLHFSENKMICFKKGHNPNGIEVCVTPCKTSSCNFPPQSEFMFPPLQPQLPKQSPLNEKHVLQNSAIITGLAGCVFIFLIFMVLKYYNFKRNNQMIINSSNQFDTPQEFIDEEHGFVFAPIHSIVTQGLSQPVIDSIIVWKYKKEEGLIDGTECSVCLVKFQEDERLRLLPKCNHAFHISCIDIWLSSHKNCPLCRAPIVCENANVAQVSVSELNLSSSSVQRQEETQLENVVNNGETISHQVEEERRNSENSMKGLCNSSPILRILTDNEVIRGKEIQPIMRSVSLDSSSALMIYHALGNFIPDQGSSKSFVKKYHFGIISKQGRKNLSLYKLMKGSSMGNALHRRSISMKRSWSSSRKNFSSKLLSRSLSSIL